MLVKAGIRPHEGGGVRFQFWYWGVLRLVLGVAQIAVVLWCIVLLIHEGIDARTMHVAFLGAGITSASMVLFKVIKRS